VVGQSFAGHGFDGTLEPSTCVRIFTGAPVPNGADHVIIQELVDFNRNFASIKEQPLGPPFIRKRASDFARRSEILAKGNILDARALVAAAGGDIGLVEVFRRPRLRVVSTGDELVEPGRASETGGAVPDSVSLGIAALAEEYGAICIERLRFGDDLELIQSAATAALESADVVVLAGGASVGEKDFAKEMFVPLGLQLLFSKVSIKPGKPAWFGTVRDRLIVGVPGNPTSALVTARLILAPLLALMQGRDIGHTLDWRLAPLAAPLPPSGDRETFHRGFIRDGKVEILRSDDSSAQKLLAKASILVRQRPHSPALEKGMVVDVLDF
ncbi:MAG TPA: molybdopterin molybdotransferase MoeA, partial [Sphingomicrobium sp.]|nr:molybdopterin molybdotransferase MoeA [Sphingomicrobium sp.]